MLGIKGEMKTKVKEEQRSLTKAIREIKGGTMLETKDKVIVETRIIGHKNVPSVGEEATSRVNAV